MALITYPDKSTGDTFSGTEATEIKSVVNTNRNDSDTSLNLKANISNPTFTTGITTPLIKITSGSPGDGKVLTSDADGDGTWVAPAVITVDAVPTNGSTNPVSSNGVFDAITGVYSDMESRLLKTDFVWGEIPSGTKNGVNAVFTIANANPSQIAVYSDGSRINAANFSVSGTTLTFTDPGSIPNNSLQIDCIK